jgi:hypothetical protein
MRLNPLADNKRPLRRSGKQQVKRRFPMAQLPSFSPPTVFTTHRHIGMQGEALAV